MQGGGAALELDQIQALVVRGNRFPRARFFVLRIDDGKAARAWLQTLTAGGAAPQLTSAAAPVGEPTYCLNLGFTRPGLEAIGVSGFDFRSFPSFVAGAAARAQAVGDIGASAPQRWLGSLGSGSDHVILTLYALDATTLEALSGELRKGFSQAGALSELLAFDAAALKGEKVHFGYRDGMTQPTIAGGPDQPRADAQPAVPAWNFVLLNDPDRSYRLPEPQWLGLNGSFGVFRILRQDVVGFEQFLHSQPGVDPELLAAKICGRWRNGVPLSLSPDSADTTLPDSEWNRFDYVAPDFEGGLPASAVFDDTAGVRCPMGSHIRRVNPRSTPVTGGGGHLHRIIRRGLPFGPVYDPSQPYDGKERGLAGFFINASIENQYEFVVRKWMNEGGFAAGLSPSSRDCITGNNDAASSHFEVPRAGKPPLVLSGFARFVETRGGAYCFLPSLAALQRIAGL